MPFISGPSGSDGIPIETDAGVKEFDAISASGTIKAGTPIEMVDVFNIGNAHTISGMGTYKQMYPVGDGRILAYSSYTKKLCLFQLSGDTLNNVSSIDIPASLLLQSGEHDYSTYYHLKIISDSSAVFVKSSDNGVVCAAVSFVSNTITIGTPYIISSYSRITHDVVIKLDNSHVLIFTTILTDSSSFECHPVLTILNVSSTSISKENSIQLTQETYGGYSDMIRLKDYVLVAWHPDSSDSKYHACFKYVNGSMSMCGSPTYNAKVSDGIIYISDNSVYAFESVSNGYDGYQTNCSDSGIDANTSRPYTIWSTTSSGDYYEMQDGQILCTTAIGNINITKNTNINIVQNNGYEAYLIFKDAYYCYSAVQPTWWKSLVLYRQFEYTTSESRYYSTAPRFSIDDNHVFFSDFGNSSTGLLTYCICTFRPTIKRSTYIPDGIATTDITPSSGKCAIF